MISSARFPIFGASASNVPVSGAFRRVSLRFSGANEGNGDQFVRGMPNELQILPLEEQISNDIVKACHSFWKAYPGKIKANQTPTYQFVDSIHLCQDALAGARFWGSMNAQSRRRKGAKGERMTSDARLEEIIQWGKDFRVKTLSRQTTEAGTAIMTHLCDAYDGLMELTRQFPDQHNYDDFQKGMKQIDRLLVKLANGTPVAPK